MHRSGCTVDDMKKELVSKGGLAGYLGTDDARKVEAMIDSGDEKARLVFEAMAYQVAKDIGAMATVLEGKVDAVVLTGGLAHSAMLVWLIIDRAEFIAPVLTYPGENELAALAEAGLLVLRGEEEVLPYD
jgi:butyrate kinase